MPDDPYRAAIGRSRSELETPALLLDLDIARRNIAVMAGHMERAGKSLRPHTKTHKAPQIARLQVDAGAIGVSTATAWEAIVMIDAGVDDILVANEVVGPSRIRALAEVARDGRVTVAVDSAANLDDLSAAAVAAGSVIGVLVEVDVGMNRGGVRSKEEALDVARHAVSLPGIEWRGAMGYEGHCMLEPDRALRIEKCRAANDMLLEVVDAYGEHGHSTDIVAAGGLGTWDITGANPRITEIHAGSYIFSDAFHRNLAPGFDPALTILTTVISRHGNVAILDCGRKSIGIDRTLPEVVSGEGAIMYAHGEHFIHEEHTALELDAGSHLQVGDRVELMPGYSPTTVNYYDIYHVVRDDIVVDVWPVLGRYGSATAGVGPVR